ncbi:hypothetical protein I7I51_08362 [Histoplasma capsulatum]|uniref:Ankyrin repeat protein n=1 Tax=Ajellomyces capsulatus TaxID=5037 RepID=A0A8A1M3B8_AJECA|nr:hypothetical protein I7I51_08362 [Histoplasma capsulatum]
MVLVASESDRGTHCPCAMTSVWVDVVASTGHPSGTAVPMASSVKASVAAMTAMGVEILACLHQKHPQKTTTAHVSIYCRSGSSLSLSHDEEVEVNSKDNYGWTPLYWAAWNGHEKVIEQLNPWR